MKTNLDGSGRVTISGRGGSVQPLAHAEMRATPADRPPDSVRMLGLNFAWNTARFASTSACIVRSPSLAASWNPSASSSCLATRGSADVHEVGFTEAMVQRFFLRVCCYPRAWLACVFFVVAHIFLLSSNYAALRLINLQTSKTTCIVTRISSFTIWFFNHKAVTS